MTIENISFDTNLNSSMMLWDFPISHHQEKYKLSQNISDFRLIIIRYSSIVANLEGPILDQLTSWLKARTYELKGIDFEK